MNIKQMLYTLIKRPHIVEQGESNGWAYRKWSDGTAECWKRLYKSTTVNNPYNSVYGSPALNDNFPFTFSEVPVVQVTINPVTEGSVWLITGSQTSETFTGAYFILSYSSRSSFTYHVNWYVIGKWK